MRRPPRASSEALAADPDNLDLRRQVFAAPLASGEFDEPCAGGRGLAGRDRRRHRRGRSCSWPSTACARGKHAQARDLLERLGERRHAGPVQPMLLAWAAFGAGDVKRGAGQDRLADARTQPASTGCARYHRAADAGARRAAGARASTALKARPFARARGRPGARHPDAWPSSAGRGRPRRRPTSWSPTRERRARRTRSWQRLARGPGERRRGWCRWPTRGTGMGDALVGHRRGASSTRSASAQALLLARMADVRGPRRSATPGSWSRRVLLDQGNAGRGAARRWTSIPDDSPRPGPAGLLRAGRSGARTAPTRRSRCCAAMASRAPAAHRRARGAGRPAAPRGALRRGRGGL